MNKPKKVRKRLRTDTPHLEYELQYGDREIAGKFLMSLMKKHGLVPKREKKAKP